jgi:hypothetical protein
MLGPWALPDPDFSLFSVFTALRFTSAWFLSRESTPEDAWDFLELEAFVCAYKE